MQIGVSWDCNTSENNSVRFMRLPVPYSLFATIVHQDLKFNEVLIVFAMITGMLLVLWLPLAYLFAKSMVSKSPRDQIETFLLYYKRIALSFPLIYLGLQFVMKLTMNRDFYNVQESILVIYGGYLFLFIYWYVANKLANIKSTNDNKSNSEREG